MLQRTSSKFLNTCVVNTCAKRWRKKSMIMAINNIPKTLEKMLAKNLEQLEKPPMQKVNFAEKSIYMKKDHAVRYNRPSRNQKMSAHNHILRFQIQELLNSGEICEDILHYDVKLTSSQMTSTETCTICWEALGESADHKVYESLNRNSGTIRYLLVNSFVLSKVPKLKFALDEKSPVNVKKIFDDYPEAFTFADEDVDVVEDAIEQNNDGNIYDLPYSKLMNVVLARRTKYSIPNELKVENNEQLNKEILNIDNNKSET